jgi:hypothetical protein
MRAPAHPLTQWKNARPASSGVTGLNISEKTLNQGAATIAGRHCSVRTSTNRIWRGGHIRAHLPANVWHPFSPNNSRRYERVEKALREGYKR